MTIVAELGSTTDPRALVPGSVEAIREEIAQCSRTGAGYLRTGDGLKQLDTADWKGEAADAFHEAFDGQPTAWIRAGQAFLDAAEALDQYADTLEWAQGQAREAIALWQEGQAATKQAEAEHATAVEQAQEAGRPAPPFVDPGAEKRQAAEDMLHRARTQLTEAGDRAASTLEEARDRAPDKPGFWGGLWGTLGQVGQGVGQWFGDLGELVTNLDEIPANVSAALAHPMEFAKGLISWDQFHTNPARAVGHVLPDAALSLLGGAGAVKKGGSVLSGVNTALKAAKANRVLDRATYNGKNIAEHVADKGTDIGHAPAKKKKMPIRIVDSAHELNQVWRELSRGGTPLPSDNHAKRMILPDGSIIGYRMKDGEGASGHTLDIRGPNGEQLKIHVKSDARM